MSVGVDDMIRAAQRWGGGAEWADCPDCPGPLAVGEPQV